MGLASRIEKYFEFQQPIVWKNAIGIAVIDVALIYSLAYYVAYEGRISLAVFCNNDAEVFRNRKSYFSINVQVICNANLEAMDVVARWPGSSHDATIFNSSRIAARFERGEFANSLLLAYLYGLMAALSITIGAHRLWTHRTYKAKLPLRIWIMYWYMASGMYGVVQWVRDHRCHHKYADTDADPHNINRGFFFAHCGWLMMKRHPEVKEKGKLIDVSDVLADPVVQFAEKYFIPVFILAFFLIPVLFGHYVLNESWTVCIVGIVMGRYAMMLNLVWLVNSWAHYYGYKPYNKNIWAVNHKLAAYLTLGEGWHNFHHVFPWDYRIGELGQSFQLGTHFINFYAWLGLAYDLKTAPAEMVKKVKEKNGELGKNEEIPEMEINYNVDKEFNYLKEHNVTNGKVKAR